MMTIKKGGKNNPSTGSRRRCKNIFLHQQPIALTSSYGPFLSNWRDNF